MMDSKRDDDVYTNDREQEDPLEILGTCDLEPFVVDMMTRFGGENAETALITRIFWFDGDTELIWETQFCDPDRPDYTSKALIFGLMVLFAGRIELACTPLSFTPVYAFDRWKYVTRDLLRLGEVAKPAGPWLYGWALFGADLCAEATPLEFPELDDLPASMAEMSGWTEAEILELEQRLIASLLE